MLLVQFLFNVCSRSEFSPMEGGMVEEELEPNRKADDGSSCDPAEINAARKVQKVYRSYRTRRRLADSVVVAEEFWWQALDYARLEHSTVSFFDHLHREPVASRWSRVAINASKVGHGLNEDDHARTLAFQHWIEAIDPRHRYGHNLEFYYREWCNGTSDEPFFYWLDVGEGRNINLKDCPRSKLRTQCVTYLGPVSLENIFQKKNLEVSLACYDGFVKTWHLIQHEREHYEYVIKEGRIVHKQRGVVLDTRKDSKEEKWIFVVSSEKKIYAGVKKKGSFHHSSFLAGGATIAAGRLTVHDGNIKCISAHSGHYRPKDENIDTFLDLLRENGVDLNEVEVIRSSNDDDDEESKQDQLPEFHESGTPEQTNATDETIEPSAANNKDVASPKFDRTASRIQVQKSCVPKEAILKRINSRKQLNSYQLGHQLPRSWSTGAGPRIGCVADYPVELRAQALEFVRLSPNKPVHA